MYSESQTVQIEEGAKKISQRGSRKTGRVHTTDVKGRKLNNVKYFFERSSKKLSLDYRNTEIRNDLGKRQSSEGGSQGAMSSRGNIRRGNRDSEYRNIYALQWKENMG